MQRTVLGDNANGTETACVSCLGYLLCALLCTVSKTRRTSHEELKLPELKGPILNTDLCSIPSPEPHRSGLPWPAQIQMKQILLSDTCTGTCTHMHTGTHTHTHNQYIYIYIYVYIYTYTHIHSFLFIFLPSTSKAMVGIRRCLS